MKRISLSILSAVILGLSSGAAFAAAASAADGLSPEMQKVLTKAQAGDAKARVELANAYYAGNGAPRDKNEAMKWYRAAAEKGDAESQNITGGVAQHEKKYQEARAWYEKSAAQGNLLGMMNLAYLYNGGYGTKKDHKKAYQLYMQAADQGAAEAMWHMATMHGKGEAGGKPDALQRCVWLNRANKHVDLDNQMLYGLLGKDLAEVNAKLSKDKLEECKKQAEGWKPAKAAKKG